MATLIAAAEKIVTEDNNNGLPVRLYDQNGNAISVTNGIPVVVQVGGSPTGLTNPSSVQLSDGTNQLGASAHPVYVQFPSAQSVSFSKAAALVNLLGTRASPSTITTSGAGSAVTGLGSYGELLVFINITAVSGASPTLQLYLDVMDDLTGGNWYSQVIRLGSLSNITTTGQYVIALGAGNAGGPFGGTARISYVLGGTTPSFTLYLCAIGK